MVTVGTPALAAPVAGEVLPQAERLSVRAQVATAHSAFWMNRFMNVSPFHISYELTIKSLFIAGAAFRSGGKQPKLFCPEVLQALACAAPNCLKRVKE
jgi:hypothetical protein